MADLYDGYTSPGDPGVGRDATKFYSFDAKAHADAINLNTHGRPQLGTITSSATPSINTDTSNQFTITAQAVPITSMTSGISGTPTDGQKLFLRIKDNGVPQSIVWGTAWRGIGLTLPPITIPGGTLYIEALYNSADSVWDVIMARKQVLPVQIQGSASAAASSVAIPTHQIGDEILLFVFNNASVTPPAAPAAGGTVPAFATINSGVGNTCAAITTQFVATANNHTSGTWTNATGIVAVVLRGENTLSPVGGNACVLSSASGTGATSPSVTLTKSDGTSALLYFYAHRAVTAWGAAPTGCTLLTEVSTSVCCNSKNDTTSDGAIVQTLTGTAVGIMTAVVEIVAAT